MLQDNLPDNRDDGPLLHAYGRIVGPLCKAALAIASVLIIVDLLLIGAAVLLLYVFSIPIVGGDAFVAFTLTASVMLFPPHVFRNNGTTSPEHRRVRHAGVHKCITRNRPKN